MRHGIGRIQRTRGLVRRLAEARGPSSETPLGSNPYNTEAVKHARDGDTSLQEAAFASGGQFVSTDYVVPNPDFGTDYSAAVPGGYVARCNPVSAPADCDSDLIRP
ncbi:MAG: hypothetical protein JRF54_10090 [Deltaproteobacteria bacterium]|nr:hypothetical protein [Deltaproteobacteria bacterium]